ncbi:MAG: RsmE family RNA methyltransferase, partial [Gammaproteobacteria bacterium]
MEPRIFSNEPLAPDSEIVLTGNAQAHVSKVLRLREGAAVVLFDGSGLEFAARIESVTRRGVAIAVGTGRDPGTESRLAVTLVQGICRGQRMDLLIQKSTELGIASIRPVHCERSVVRLDAARASRKTGHWRQIAISACEQS